jgi:hypothetical protein
MESQSTGPSRQSAVTTRLASFADVLQVAEANQSIAIDDLDRRATSLKVDHEDPSLTASSQPGDKTDSDKEFTLEGQLSDLQKSAPNTKKDSVVVPQEQGVVDPTPSNKARAGKKVLVKTTHDIRTSSRKKVSEDQQQKLPIPRMSVSDLLEGPASSSKMLVQSDSTRAEPDTANSPAPLLSSAVTTSDTGAVRQDDRADVSAKPAPARALAAAGTPHHTASTASGITTRVQEAPRGMDDTSSAVTTKQALAAMASEISPDTSLVVSSPFQPSVQNATTFTMLTKFGKGDLVAHPDVTTREMTRTTHAPPAARHLEVTVDDPVLGNVEVRTELRAGHLRALVSSNRDLTPMEPELQRYLKQHDVALHTVTFASPTSSEPSASMKAVAAGDSFNGGSGDPPPRESGAQQQRNTRSPDAQRYEARSTLEHEPAVRPSAHSNRPEVAPIRRMGSTLSIHI